MTDGVIAGKFRKNLVGEDVGDVPHRLMGMDLIAVAGGDAGALLAAMLQGIKSEIRELRCFRMAVNGNDTALFTEFIKHGWSLGVGGKLIRSVAKVRMCWFGSKPGPDSESVTAFSL